MCSSALKIMCALLFGVVVLVQTGCACCGARTAIASTEKAPCDPCDKEQGEMAAALPPNAKPGECYAKVFAPPRFKTVTERVLVRDASDTIEIIPAKYEWVEEKVLVKDASTQLEAVPAEFAPRSQTFEVNSGHTDWEINKNASCTNLKDEPARDIFCLVKHPPVQQTIQTQCQVKPASIHAVGIPAEYQTVRRQKLVSPATTRKVCIPAEYASIEKTMKICDGRMVWKLVNCDKASPDSAAFNANQPPAVATVNAKRTDRP